jgi:Putative adhesin
MGGELMTALMEPPTEERTPSGVRWLWKLFAAILVLGAFVSGTFQIVGLLAHEERTEESSYPAAGIARIDVSNSSGSVRIVGTDADVIAVTAEISDGFRSTGESQEVVGDTLELRGTCPNFGSDWCRVTYEISVPASLEVHVDTDDGSIVGAGLRSANVTANSGDGRVELGFAAAPTTVSATTGDGSVTVVVPDDDETYRLDVHTDDGSVSTEQVPTDPDSERSLTLRTRDGNITARTG